MTSNSLRTRFVHYAILVLLLVMGATNAFAGMILDIRLPDNVFIQSMGVTSTGFRGISNSGGIYGTATVYDILLDGSYTTWSLSPLGGFVGAEAWISPDGQTIAGNSIRSTGSGAPTNWTSGNSSLIPSPSGYAWINAVGNGGVVGGIDSVYPHMGTVNGVARISPNQGDVTDVRPGRAGGVTSNGPTVWNNGAETNLPQVNGGIVHALGINNNYGEDDGKFAMWQLMTEIFSTYNGETVSGYFSGNLGGREGAYGYSEDFGAMLTRPDGITLWTFREMCVADLGNACPMLTNPRFVHSFVEGHGMWAFNGLNSSHIYIQDVPTMYRDSSAVPEPGSLGLTAIAIGLAAAFGRKRLKRTP